MNTATKTVKNVKMNAEKTAPKKMYKRLYKQMMICFKDYFSR